MDGNCLMQLGRPDQGKTAPIYPHQHPRTLTLPPPQPPCSYRAFGMKCTKMRGDYTIDVNLKVVGSPTCQLDS